MWGRIILVALGALAALVLALLMLPARVTLTVNGENAKIRFTVDVSPWPFIFSFRAISRPFTSQLTPAEGQSLADRLVELLSKARRLIAVFSRSVAPRHQIIDFTVRLSMGVGDAAATALLVGAAHAVTWTAVRVLFSRAQRVPVRSDVVIEPQYSAIGATVHASVTVQVRPVGLLRSRGLWRAATRAPENRA